jgi:prepilin-type N-terminal cleavage/methylation domain-containing protein
MNANNCRHSGFTAVELIATLTIVGVLLALAAPGLRQLTLNQGVKTAAFDMLSLCSGLGGGNSSVVVGERFRPDISRAIPVAAVVLTDMICDRRHYVFLLRIRISNRARWPSSNAD